VCKFGNDPLCFDELIGDDLVVRTPSLEHINQNCEDGRDDDELLLLVDKQFKDEFTKFCEKIYVEEQKISPDLVEKNEAR